MKALFTATKLLIVRSQLTKTEAGRLRLPSDHHPSGQDFSVHKIVQKSSNRGAAQLGIKLGC